MSLASLLKEGQLYSTPSYTPQSNNRRYFGESTTNIPTAANSGTTSRVGGCDSQSYISSMNLTTSSTSRLYQLQPRLTKSPLHIQRAAVHSAEDYEAGESICHYMTGVNTNEIEAHEVFMPITKHSAGDCHQSKLAWEKENINHFHIIKNIDTGDCYDVRDERQLKEVTNQTPRLSLSGGGGESGDWSVWWERKRGTERDFEKACKLNLSEQIIEILQRSESDLLPNLNGRISDERWNPLHFAAFYGNTSVCNLLIFNDVFIDAENDLAQTPLILSCIENKQDVAQLLIESGANVNAQDTYLNTPLHYCFLNGDRDLLDIVLRKPYIDINLANRNGKLAWQETENEELVAYFKQQVSKKEQQRNIKAQREIIEYDDDEEDQCGIHLLSEPPQQSPSFIMIEHRQSIACDMDRFIVKGLLGKGSYGEVYLVIERATQKEFALKMLRKKDVEENNMYKYAITERNVLQIVDHPFVTRLTQAFQTRDKLFFLMENGKQGDLSQHLTIEKKFSESKAQFYAAEVLLALEYLHSMDIMYRDLKSQNILLAEDGHVRLSDFGLSKEGVHDYDQGARSFCGSVAYMPPEILRNQPHGKSIDLYLFGVLIYEMITGFPPFYGKDENTIYNNIQMSPLKFPSFVSRTAKSLLIKLLSKEPRFRPSIDMIKRHPFFAGIPWKQMLMKNVKPPKTVQKEQRLYETSDDIFVENNEVNISPHRLYNVKHDCSNSDTNQQIRRPSLFYKWTFIAE